MKNVNDNYLKTRHELLFHAAVLLKLQDYFQSNHLMTNPNYQTYLLTLATTLSTHPEELDYFFRTGKTPPRSYASMGGYLLSSTTTPIPHNGPVIPVGPKTTKDDVVAAFQAIKRDRKSLRSLTLYPVFSNEPTIRTYTRKRSISKDEKLTFLYLEKAMWIFFKDPSQFPTDVYKTYQQKDYLQAACLSFADLKSEPNDVKGISYSTIKSIHNRVRNVYQLPSPSSFKRLLRLIVR